MSLVDLANTKIRVIGCSAIMAVGQLISSAIANPGTQAAAGMMGGPIAIGGVSILAAIAGGIAGNIAVNDLGNRMTEKLAKNPNILDNHDLVKAAGEAIDRVTGLTPADWGRSLLPLSIHLRTQSPKPESYHLY